MSCPHIFTADEGTSHCTLASVTAKQWHEMRAALHDARHYILNRHNMGRQKREEQRLYVLKSINEVLDDKRYEYSEDKK